MLGREIQQYRIVDKIGEGGMGSVWKAEDTRLQRLIAIKAISKHLSMDEEVQERFLREAQAASSLNHPNIATIHELLEEGDERFIVMEFVEGKTIRNMVEDNRVSTKKAVEILLQAAEALEAAHNKGILHRDIKSANIMVSLDGRVKVMDFGLAQLEEKSQLTRTGTTLGTLAYSSPEQISGRPVDRRSEVFSLGVVFFELLTGRLPFKGSSEAEVVFAIINNEPPHLSELREDGSDLLEAVVSRMLEKDPDQRYASCGDLVTDLKALKRGVETSTVPVRGPLTAPLPASGISATHRSARPAKKTGTRTPRSWLMGIAAAAVIVVGVLLIMTVGTSPGPAPFAGETRQVTFSGTASDPAISPDGEWLAYTDQGRLLLLDLAGGGQPEELAPDITQPGSPQWHPDGTLIFFIGSGTYSTFGDLYRVPRTGGQPRMIYRDLLNFSLGPDGREAVISDRILHAGADTLKLVDLDSQREIRRLPLGVPGTFVTYPDRSKDGHWILGVSYTIGDFTTQTARIMSPEGDLTEEWSEPITATDAAWWADDGGGFYFIMDEQPHVLLYQAINPRSGKRIGDRREILTNLPEGFSVADVSREGHMAVYRTGRSTSTVEVIELTGPSLVPSTPRSLTTGTASITMVSISPDGGWVLYIKRIGTGQEIYIQPFEGGPEQQVTNGTIGKIDYAEWSPDASWIAYESNEDGGQSRSVHVVGREGGLPRRVFTGSSDLMTPLAGWVPDSSHLVIGEQDRFVIMDLEGKMTASYPIPDSLGLPGPVWFPSEEGTMNVMILDIQGEGVNNLIRVAELDQGSGKISRITRVPSEGAISHFSETLDEHLYWARKLPPVPGQTATTCELVRMPLEGDRPERVALLPWGNPETIGLSRDLRRAVSVKVTETSDLWIATDWFPKR